MTQPPSGYVRELDIEVTACKTVVLQIQAKLDGDSPPPVSGTTELDIRLVDAAGKKVETISGLVVRSQTSSRAFLVLADRYESDRFRRVGLPAGRYVLEPIPVVRFASGATQPDGSQQAIIDLLVELINSLPQDAVYKSMFTGYADSDPGRNQELSQSRARNVLERVTGHPKLSAQIKKRLDPLSQGRGELPGTDPAIKAWNRRVELAVRR